MAEEVKKYESKFLFPGTYKSLKTIDFTSGLHQVSLCLESEGVKLSDASVAKCVDIYLRINGFADNNGDEFPPVKAMCAPVSFNNIYGDTAKNPEHRVELTKDLITLINNYVDDDHKFIDNDGNNEIEVIKNNVSTIFKEINIFLNDIMEMMLDEYEADDIVTVIAMAYVSDDNFLKFVINFDANYDTTVMTIISTVLVKDEGIDKHPIGIMIKTFSEEMQKKIRDVFKNDKEDNGSKPEED